MRLNCLQSVVCVCFVVFLTTAVFAQNSEPAAKSDARSLVQAALDSQKAADASAARYTNFRHVVETNRDERGRVNYRWNQLFEDTWINNLPYERLVERGDRPLKGKELREEQQLYDDAIHGRRPLGNQQRIALDGAHAVSSGTNFSDALEPAYTVTEVGQEPSPDGILHVIEAAHVRSKSSSCSWRYRLWITDAPARLMRFHADVAPNDGATSCGDATEDETRILVDGVPKPAHNRTHFYVHTEDGWITVDSEITFTKYRRFSSTVTISPATVVPPSDTPH